MTQIGTPNDPIIPADIGEMKTSNPHQVPTVGDLVRAYHPSGTQATGASGTAPAASPLPVSITNPGAIGSPSPGTGTGTVVKTKEETDTELNGDESLLGDIMKLARDFFVSAVLRPRRSRA